VKEAIALVEMERQEKIYRCPFFKKGLHNSLYCIRIATLMEPEKPIAKKKLSKPQSF
jgi:hypothetical protein